MHSLNGLLPPSEYRVLLGDDDPAMLRLLSRWLEKAGYPTRTATDGQEALDAIELECPNFVITDWEMPRVNGLELCRRIREMTLPHYVYVLFLTVRNASAEVIAGLEIGADDFLSKPVSKDELFARMRSGSRTLELERHLSLMARTDSLTGLMTQRCFYESLTREWHRSRRSRLPLSCVMLDLDFFKQVNDVHGHPTGDAVLKSVAKLLIDNCRASDTVCRYGGEEFCVLLPETNELDAAAWAERVRKRLAAAVIQVGTREVRLTGSFGVAQCHDGVQNSEELVDLADQALLCAKRAGRDRIARYASLVDAANPKLRLPDQQDGVFQGILARDVMSRMTDCLYESQTIGEAVQFFLSSGTPSTPVIGADGALVGFLSEADLLTVMASPDCWQRPLSAVMRPNVISYEEDVPIRVIYEFLCRVSIHRVVVTSGGRPTGTISRNSLLQWFHHQVAGKGLIAGPSSLHVSCGCNTTDTASAPELHSLDNEPAVQMAE